MVSTRNAAWKCNVVVDCRAGLGALGGMVAVDRELTKGVDSSLGCRVVSIVLHRREIGCAICAYDGKCDYFKSLIRAIPRVFAIRRDT
jgi:hypothetical protein